ncbi:hypothetical protein L798_13931 [Zootermopsis nevadensis]|uniref:Uncharacterized protein n=1 Tax=Zootermopsis nevadensis TaxID=136037 RepID=A0A067QTK2_ZOONE|nr:hypothetical protein L798_13931 [Zootermopsis nevadensis]
MNLPHAQKICPLKSSRLGYYQLLQTAHCLQHNILLLLSLVRSHLPGPVLPTHQDAICHISDTVWLDRPLLTLCQMN